MLISLIQGVIQGLTEFLPVSSSGHLLLVQQVILGSQNKELITGIHLATLLSLLVYFREKIWVVALGTISKCKGKINQNQTEQRISIKAIILSTIFVAFFGALIKFFNLESYLTSLPYIGISSIIFSILMFVSYTKNNESKEKISLVDGIIIGSSQLIAAVLPGASRSGVTLTTGFLLKVNKSLCVEYTFLLSIPTIFLASMYEILINQSIVINPQFVVAFLSAFISGLIAIKVMHLISGRNLILWFTLYRLAFGFLCIFVHYHGTPSFIL